MSELDKSANNSFGPEEVADVTMSVINDLGRRGGKEMLSSIPNVSKIPGGKEAGELLVKGAAVVAPGAVAAASTATAASVTATATAAATAVGTAVATAAAPIAVVAGGGYLAYKFVKWLRD